MQLKKNGRETPFAESQEQYEAADNDEAFEMPEAVTRQQRPRVPELEADGAAANREPAGRQESVVDGHSTFDGRYETQHDLRIQGSVSGEVACRGTLTIEKDAVVRAKIQSRDAIIRGRLEGDIACSGKLTLASSSNVSGTLKAATLVVEEGATLSGTVEASASPARGEERIAAVPPAPIVAEEARVERRQTAAAEPVAAGERRNGRQTPNFAFVSSDERRPDRN